MRAAFVIAHDAVREAASAGGVRAASQRGSTNIIWPPGAARRSVRASEPGEVAAPLDRGYGRVPLAQQRGVSYSSSAMRRPVFDVGLLTGGVRRRLRSRA